MKKVLLSFGVSIMATIGFGQCEPVVSIDENFDGWSDSIDPCWDSIGNGGMIYPDSDVTFYAFMSAGIDMFLISPEIVEGIYDLKLDGYTHSLDGGQMEGITLEIGTISNPADASTFQAITEAVDLVNDPQVFETEVQITADAKYFAIKIGSVAPHSAAGIDNLTLNAVTAGVHDLDDVQVQIYPNPVANQLNINSVETIQEINIFDMSGKLVNSTTANALSTSVNLSNLKAGVYVAQIRTAKGTKTVKVLKK